MLKDASAQFWPQDLSSTRGVFALIFPTPTTLLLSEYRDRVHWNLPGGGVRGGETDEQALRREVYDETGLIVRLRHKVGKDRVAGNDTAVLYECDIVGGVLMPTEESHQHILVDTRTIQSVSVVSDRMMQMVEDGLAQLADSADQSVRNSHT